MLCALLGLGGLATGATGPLLSNFLPVLVAQALTTNRTAIGAVMAIDNLLMLLLVPWTGAASDRATSRGGGRLNLLLAGVVLAAVGMTALAFAASLRIVLLVLAIVVLYTGIHIQRSPFQALIADLVESRHRSAATSSVTLMMCIGAILFLGMANLFAMRLAFLAAAATLLAITVLFATRLNEGRPAGHQSPADESVASLLSFLKSSVFSWRSAVPAMRPIFIASFCLQLTFQTFTTWFALHATERFGLAAEEATLGFMAWAVGGVLGSVPAGIIGTRIGRRPAILLGLGMMAACLLAIDRIASFGQAIPLLLLASASWALPTVNAFPLFVEPLPRERRGILSALYLLSMALGGLIGDPLNGRLFDLLDSYRSLFVVMAVYASVAFLTVLQIPPGVGEAVTQPLVTTNEAADAYPVSDPSA